MSTTTRKDIRQRIGKVGFCGDVTLCTSTNASPTTATYADTTNLANTANLYQGAQIVITSGSAINNRRLVSTSTASTGLITPDRAFSANVASGDTAEVHRLFSADDKDEAINAAIQESKAGWPRMIEDTSYTFTVNTFTYALSAFNPQIERSFGIDKIEYDTGASGTGYPYAVLDDELWQIRINAGTLTLQLHEYVNGIIPSGKTIRITYRARPATLSNDTTAIEPDNEGFYEYICAKATALAAEKKGGLSGETSDARSHWFEMAARFHQKADMIFDRDAPEPIRGKVLMNPGGFGRRSRLQSCTGSRGFDPAQYEGDHFIPLALGGFPGADGDYRNFWDEPRNGTHTCPGGQCQGSASDKDKVELFLYHQVCAGAMHLADAQRGIAANWTQYMTKALMLFAFQLIDQDDN